VGTDRKELKAPDSIGPDNAMALIGLYDGVNAKEGISYLHLAEGMVKYSAQSNKSLKELWTRIVFNICVSNAVNHLQYHGFLLPPKGWILSPAYDMNPVVHATGLHLNINEFDNALELDPAREVAGRFRILPAEMEEIIAKVLQSVEGWSDVAKERGLSRSEIMRMEPAFRVA
jgi:serine/threonine-protein kinase HipA